MKAFFRVLDSLTQRLASVKARQPEKIRGTLPILKRRRGVIYWNKPSTLSFIFSILAAVSIGIAVLSVSVPVLPMVWYRIRPGTSSALARILARPAVSFGDLLAASGEREIETYQPPVDPTLPKQNRIRIAKIGVDTQIYEETSENYEAALKKGVWRVPNLGTPFLRKYPTILVAHRFGYLSWTNSFRLKNSFFNLPKLSPGDRIEVIWEQRLYRFEVYGGDKSEMVTDYTADLILYTCEYLESPIRIFKYAKLVK